MFGYHSSLKNLRAERSCSAKSHRWGEVGASHCSCSVWQTTELLRSLMHDRSAVSLWGMARRASNTLPQECCLFPNIPSTLPLRDGPMVKSRDVVVLKPNSVCQVHPKCWERKIRRDTCRCWTVNGGCKMAQCKMLPLLFTITNEQTEQKSEESNFWVAISVA